MQFDALTPPDGPLLRDAQAFATRWGDNDTVYIVSVGLPFGARLAPDRPRRLLYVLDGDIFFAGALQAIRLMSVDITADPLPEMLVVGIGWADVAGQPVYPLFRFRDFSPQGAKPPPWLASGPIGAQPFGGSPSFRRFLSEAVDPWIRASYAVDNRPAILWGYSYGGYLALDGLFAGDTLATDYIIGSPGVVFEDDVLFEREAALADEALAGRIVLTIGGGEESGPNADYRRIARNTRLLADRLSARQHADFSIRCLTLEGESHSSGAFRSLVEGLRFLQVSAGGL